MLRDDEGRPKNVTRLEMIGSLVAIVGGMLTVAWMLGGSLIANHDNVMQAQWDIRAVKEQQALDHTDMRDMKVKMDTIYNWLVNSPGGIKSQRGANLP